MAKKILIALVVMVVILVTVIAMQPAAFTIERRTTINAPVSLPYAQVNDFHKWASWSPWEKMESDLNKTYSGPESGVGAHYAWAGKETGEGNMTIVEAQPFERIAIDLNFTKPVEASNKTTFTFKPSGPATEVVWSMTGHKNFMSKAFGLVMDMDKMVGGDFEKGLAEMKTLAETEAAKVVVEPAVAVAPVVIEADAGTP